MLQVSDIVYKLTFGRKISSVLTYLRTRVDMAKS